MLNITDMFLQIVWPCSIQMLLVTQIEFKPFFQFASLVKCTLKKAEVSTETLTVKLKIVALCVTL